jgi:ribonuclease P protein component
VETRRLTKEERLRLRRDFDRIFSQGRSVHNAYLRLVYIENGLDHPRIAIVVKKKIGKAVFRNRLRRLVREVYRLNKEKFPNVDVVFVFRDRAKDLKKPSYWDMERIVLDLVEKMR